MGTSSLSHWCGAARHNKCKLLKLGKYLMGKLLMWLVAPFWLASASGAIAWWVWLLPIAELERRLIERLDHIGQEDD